MKLLNLSAVLFALLFASTSAQTKQPERPNIIYIMADDLGYGDLGCYGQEKIKTPEIDKLSARGMRFTAHYAGTAVCAPTRCSLMTGLHTGHTYIRANSPRFPNGQTPIPTDTENIAKLMKRAGYATACIGKWGLGNIGNSGDANAQGFDLFYGYYDQRHAHNYYTDHLFRNDKRIELDGKTYSHDLMTDEALKFIDDNQKKPFFLYLPYCIPHAKLQVPSLGEYAQKDWNKSHKTQAAMITRLDRDVGRIARRIARLGLAKKTLIIFTSDHGAHGGAGTTKFFKASGKLRGIKRSLYEGGVRVPMIAYWPGTVPAGTTSKHISAFWDVMPTLADLSGEAPKAKHDGISMLPTLVGDSTHQKQHDYLYWELFEGRPNRAIRMGKWKGVMPNLYKGDKLQLFDLDADEGETTDIAAKHPKIVAELRGKIAEARTYSPIWNIASRGFNLKAACKASGVKVPEKKRKKQKKNKEKKVSVPPRPNVVLIYGDDVGFADVGAYGAKLIPTPNLDRLAAQSLMFTDAHCSAATCTPSRFSLLTGIHGFRHGVRVLRPNAPLTIKPHMLTLPQLFKRAGYDTAIIGKWHLGIGDGKTPVDWNGEVKPGPLEVGFDYSFLLPSTNDRVPCVYVENHRVVGLDPRDPLFVGKSSPASANSTVYPNGKKTPEAMTYYRSSHGHNNSVINGIGRIGFQQGGKSALWNDENMADEFVGQAKKYLAARSKEKPFFLFFSSQDIHVPRTPHPRFHGKSKLSYRGDAMVQLDWSAGQVLAALKKHGLDDNTIVIFTSDNGPVYDDGYEDGTTVRTSTKEVDRGHDGSGPYRGGKYQIFEGGTRVPFLLRWPGHVKPGKTTALVNQIDFMGSFATLLGLDLKPSDAIDSRNTMPAFLGKDRVGLPYMLEEARGLALRQGNWKFIRGNKKQPGKLFNLANDVGESNNVAEQSKKRATSMAALLQKLSSAKGGIRAFKP